MSQKALDRIAANLKSKEKTLDLSNCGIQGRVPMELAELTWLEELDLRDNDIEDRAPTHPSKPLLTSGGQTHPLQALADLHCLGPLIIGLFSFGLIQT